MSWLLNRFPVDQPRVDDALLTVGRAAYVAARFDQDVARLLTFLELPARWAEFRTWSPEQIEQFQLKIARRQLALRLSRVGHELDADALEQDILRDARLSRNALFHEMPQIPLHSARRVTGLRPDPAADARFLAVLVTAMVQVRVWLDGLAPGCALVGAWMFQLLEQERDQEFPWPFYNGYAEQLTWWVLAPVWDLLPAKAGEPAQPQVDGAIRGV